MTASAGFDRREFLAGCAAFLAAVPQAASRRKHRIKKAVGLGMATGSASLEDKLKMIRELGFDGVEVSRPDDLPLERLLKARDAAGLAIADVIDSAHWSKTLSDPDPAVRAAGRAALEAALRDAKELGAPSVLLVPAVVNDKVSYADAYERSQEEIRRVVPLAAELKVPIAVENVWNQFLLSPLEAARFVDEIGSPWVGWHFDVGNVVTYGWPEQWIRILGKRIRNLHVKEFSRKKRDQEGTWKGFDAELLEGDVDWPAVMRALDGIGYEGWAIAEVAGGDRARLKRIAERMDRILAS